MNKIKLAAAVVGVACVSVGFHALAEDGCVTDGFETRLTSSTTPTLTDAITGKSIDANSPGGENWKEIHCGVSGGDLEKVGLGAGHPVDPQEKVGTWSIIGDAVTYNYGTGGSYTWRVYRDTNDSVVGKELCWQEDATDGGVIATGSITSVSCLP